MVKTGFTEAHNYSRSDIVEAESSYHFGKELSITVLQTVEHLQSVRDFWEKMQTCPTADFTYFVCDLEPRKDVNRPIKPHIVSLSNGNAPVSLLIGRIQFAPLGLHLGYRLLSWPRVPMMEVVQGGILGDCSESGCKSFLTAVMDTLQQGQAKVAVFRNLSLDSIMYRIVTNVLPSIRIGVQTATSWRLALPGSYREFLQSLSKRTRSTSVRYSNLLLKKYGTANIAVKCLQGPDEIEVILRDTETVARKAWQRGVDKGFVNDAETRRKYEIAADRRQLRAFILYLEGVPVAFWHGFSYHSTFFAEYTAFDPAYLQDRPGAFLLDKIIEQLCQDETTKFIDFGWGDHDYKRHYCRRGQEVADVYIYGPSVSCLILYAVKSAFDGTKNWTKTLFRRARMLDQTRKLARKRARAAASDNHRKG